MIESIETTEAFVSGYSDFLSGRTARENPFRPETQEFFQWLAGWNDACDRDHVEMN